MFSSTQITNISGVKKPTTNPPHLDAPQQHMILPRSLVVGQSIAKVLHASGLVSSKSEGHRLAAQQGAYIGSRADGSGRMDAALSFSRVKTWKPEETETFLIDGNLLILRRGKWKIKIIKLISDEEFLLSGEESPPGWEEYLKQKEEERGMHEEQRAEECRTMENAFKNQAVGNEQVQAEK
jgi:tyrosyl-tRNA synthetase